MVEHLFSLLHGLDWWGMPESVVCCEVNDAETILKKMLIVAKLGKECASSKTVCVILSSQWQSHEQPWDVAQSFGKSLEALWAVGGESRASGLRLFKNKRIV